MKENDDLLLGTTQSHPNISVYAWNYHTENLSHLYKNGGTASAKSLRVIGADYILTADEDKSLLHIWPVNSQEQVKNIRFVLPDKANCLDVDPSNSYLVAGIGLKLYLWHLNSGILLNIFHRHFQPSSCVKFSSDSSYIIIGSDDGTLTTYKLEDVACFANSNISDNESGECTPVYQKMDHNAQISHIHVGSFGWKSRMITISRDCSARIYALESGMWYLTLLLDEAPTCVLSDKTGWDIYIGTDKGTIKKVQMRTPPATLQRQVHELGNDNLIGHKNRVNCIDFNFDETILASGSDDSTIRLWDIPSRSQMKIIACSGIVTNVLFVMNHSNFKAETLRTDVVLQPLQKTIGTNLKTLVVTAKSDQIEFEDEMEDGGVENEMLDNAQVQLTKINSIISYFGDDDEDNPNYRRLVEVCPKNATLKAGEGESKLTLLLTSVGSVLHKLYFYINLNNLPAHIDLYMIDELIHFLTGV